MSKTSPYPIFAFHVLESKLNGVKRTLSLPQIKSKLNYDSTNDEPSAPLFITWNIKDRHGTKQLRGCIGTFSPMPVEEGIADYALVA